MRTYMSLVVIGVAVLAGQAGAHSVDGIKSRPSAEVVKQLRGDRYGPSSTLEHLMAADDKTVPICGKHTIEDVLALNNFTRKDCEKDAFNKRSDFCHGDLENSADEACVNVQQFCLHNVDRVDRYCQNPKFDYVEQTEATPAEAEEVKRILSSKATPMYTIRLVMQDSLNDKIEVCGQTIRTIRYNDSMDADENTQEGLKKRLMFCEGLKKDGDATCDNVREYCRQNIEWSAKDWFYTRDQLVQLGSATETYLNGLNEAYEATQNEYSEGKSMFDNYYNERTPVEKFIMSQ